MEGGGGSIQPPPVCSIHLYNVTAAILRQNAHHTHLLVERRQSDAVMLHPYSFPKDILGFLMTTESQDLTSHPKDGAC